MEGRSYHGEQEAPEQFEEDRVRFNELHVAGIRPLRLSAKSCLEPTPKAIRSLRELLLREGISGVTAPGDALAGATLEPAAAWLLGNLGESVPRVARMLFDALAAETTREGLPRSILLGRGLGGAAVLATLDVLEAVLRLSAMCGSTPPPTQDTHIVVVEPHPEHRKLAERLLNRYLGRAPTEPWRETVRLGTGYALTVLFAPQAPPEASFELVVGPVLDDISASAEEIDAWRRAVGPEGILVAGEPGSRSPDEPVAPPSPQALEPFRSPSDVDTLWFLERFFGHRRFREGQWQIVERLLMGQSVLGVLPTGAGKTVCFQLPALLSPGTALVVSPLVSLIEDQVQNVRRQGLDLAGGVHGGMPDDMQASELALLTTGRRKFFYLSPERLQLASFRSKLRSSLEDKHVAVSYFVVDEAHIASEWGHDFRPSYLEVPDHAHEFAPGRPVALLTATASKDIREDVLRMFDLALEHEVRPKDFDRPELAFQVLTAPTEDARMTELLHLLREGLPGDLAGSRSFEALHGSGEGGYTNAGLIFTPFRKRSEKDDGKVTLRAAELARALRQGGLTADHYISSDAANDLHVAHKRYVQERFKEDRLPIVVATKGFGTGIDKPNVRWAIHTGLAGSLEGYYQEAGRIGRDRKDARAVLIWAPRVPECSTDWGVKAPSCLTEPKCDYRLAEKCSFSVQAFLLSRSRPGPEADMAQLQYALKDSLAAHLERGGQVRVPISADVRAELVNEKRLRQLLDDLVKIGAVSRHTAKNPKTSVWRTIYATVGAADAASLQRANPAVVHPGAVKSLSTSGVIENLLVEALGRPRDHAERAASVWALWLAHIPPGQQGKIPLTLKASSGDSSTEKLLYRLKRLGVVERYEQEAHAWRTIVLPHERPRLEACAESFLGRVLKSQADVAAWMRKLRESLDAERGALNQVLTALRLVVNADYEIFARQRWQMLLNLEDYAASTECRKSRLLGFLGDPNPPTSCGRCDVCGIRPPVESRSVRAAQQAPHAAPSAAPLPAPEPAPTPTAPADEPAAERIHVDFAAHGGTLPFDALQDLTRDRPTPALRQLRDASLRRLEEDPNDVFALGILVRVWHGLGDPDRARRDAKRLLEVLVFRGEANPLNEALRTMPPATLARLLSEERTPIEKHLGAREYALLCGDTALALDNEEAANVAVARALRALVAEPLPTEP
ncbi:MAG: RecQ family ATP-dependent DNA helicase [Deltaproteobacteria bacterium]|nr:RecQ family ATP-dependent DNA helicase [Deltaproteobacteria bacterium]